MAIKNKGKFHWTFSDTPLFKRSFFSFASSSLKSERQACEMVSDSISKTTQNYPFWLIEQQVSKVLCNSGFAYKSIAHKALKHCILLYISQGNTTSIDSIFPETAKMLNLDYSYLENLVNSAISDVIKKCKLCDIYKYFPESVTKGNAVKACDIITYIGRWFVLKLKKYDFKF